MKIFELMEGLIVEGKLKNTPYLGTKIINWYTQGYSQRDIAKLVNASKDSKVINALKGGTVSHAGIGKFLKSQPNYIELERKYVNARFEKSLSLRREINFTPKMIKQIINWFTQGYTYGNIVKIVITSTDPEFIRVLRGGTVSQATIGEILRSQPNYSELEQKHITARIENALSLRREINFTPKMIKQIINWYTQGISQGEIAKLVSTSTDPEFIRVLRGGTVSQSTIGRFLNNQPNKDELMAKNLASREAERQRRKQQPVTKSTVAKAQGRGRGVTSIRRAGPPTGGKL